MFVKYYYENTWNMGFKKVINRYSRQSHKCINIFFYDYHLCFGAIKMFSV